MERRQFLKTSLAASGAVTLSAMTAAAAETAAPAGRELYELRLYHQRRGPEQKAFDEFFRTAAIPAWNRADVSPVGVFTVMIGPDSPTFYVLLRHTTPESVTRAERQLDADADYQKAGADFLNAPASAPAFERVESSLLLAFEEFPKLITPDLENRGRIFELRTYASHSRKAGLKKIEMFNTGEIAIFQRAGLRPVFFGESLIGGNQPNLTYLLVHDSLAARDKAWAAFGSDPEWKKLSSTPGYTDSEIVSSISNVLLKSTSYSQI